jgi:hypothetical protein
MEPVAGSDSRGVEGPQVAKTDDVFYRTHAASGREFHDSGKSKTAEDGFDAHDGERTDLTEFLQRSKMGLKRSKLP